jgi:hypothetical protein
MSDVQEARDYFLKYVTPNYPELVFEPQRVFKLQTCRSHKTRYDSSDTRVKMWFFTRDTWCLDDYDTFTSLKIKVDGKVVFKDRFL